MSELEGPLALSEQTAIETSPPPVGEAPEPSIDDTLSAAWDKAQTGLERDEGGKFKSDKPETQTTESAVQPPKEGTEPETPIVPAIDPPQSWTAEARAYWPKLPPEAQTYIAQRESEAHKAITSYGERLKSFEPLERVITQYRGDFEKRGLDAARATATLFEAQRSLDNNALDGLIQIGLSYGIDLRPLLSGQQAALPAHDPRVGQVEQRLNQIQQTIEQQRQSDVEALVNGFKADHPHFDAVQDHMAGFIPVLREKHPGLPHHQLMQKAYDEAVWANPETRTLLLTEKAKKEETERKEAEVKKQEELKKRAEEAAKAAKVNVRSGTAHATPKSVDDTLNEIARRVYG